MAITIATLKNGAGFLGLEIPAKPTKKELEASITEKLSTMELGYECPSCGKDIPDVDVCPYCSENFAEGGEVPGNEGENIDLQEDKIDINTDEVSNQDKVQDSPPPVETNAEDNKEQPKATEAKGKVNDTGAKAKGNEKVNEKPKTGKDSEEYKMLISEIDSILSGDNITKKDNASGITYLVDKKRIMKVAATTKSISIELNEEIDNDDENIRKYTEADAKAKHLGTVRAIYSFGDLDTALLLIQEAYTKRMNKVPVEAK